MQTDNRKNICLLVCVNNMKQVTQEKSNRLRMLSDQKVFPEDANDDKDLTSTR